MSKTHRIRRIELPNNQIQQVREEERIWRGGAEGVSVASIIGVE